LQQVDRSLTHGFTRLTETVQPDNNAYPAIAAAIPNNVVMLPTISVMMVVMLPGLVVMFPGAVVIFPGAVVMLPDDVNVVMLPARAVEASAAVRSEAQRIDLTRFMIILLVKALPGG
jgi:hypothetical protein